MPTREPRVTDVGRLKWPPERGEIRPAGYIGQSLTGDVCGKRGGPRSGENIMTCGYRLPGKGY